MYIVYTLSLGLELPRIRYILRIWAVTVIRYEPGIWVYSYVGLGILQKLELVSYWSGT